MTSRSDMGAQMAALARDLHAENTTAMTLQHVVDAAVQLIGACESAGITLATRSGGVTTSASTDEVPPQSDKIQEALGEGPCMDAVWSERVVSVPDVATERRWPGWAAHVHNELGVGSVACFQLFTHEHHVGALTVFSYAARAFDGDDIALGAELAAHAVVAVVSSDKVENLETALTSRTIIAQATGLIMATYKLDRERSFRLISRLSSEQNRKVAVIARELVEQYEANPAAFRATSKANRAASTAPRPRAPKSLRQPQATLRGRPADD